MYIQYTASYYIHTRVNQIIVGMGLKDEGNIFLIWCKYREHIYIYIYMCVCARARTLMMRIVYFEWKGNPRKNYQLWCGIFLLSFPFFFAGSIWIISGLISTMNMANEINRQTKHYTLFTLKFESKVLIKF